MKDVNGQRRKGNQQQLKPIEERQAEKPWLDLVINDR
jgi:hypothetical protein